MLSAMLIVCTDYGRAKELRGRWVGLYRIRHPLRR